MPPARGAACDAASVILGAAPRGHWIDGAAFLPTGVGSLTVFDPATGQRIDDYRAGSAEDVDVAVRHAAAAFKTWSRMAPANRAALLYDAAAEVERRMDCLARLDSLSVGKPLREARGEVATAAGFLRYYAGLADKLEGETIPLSTAWMAWTDREPVGVVAQIVPWNSPLSMVLRGVAPALAAGCSVVLKPAEQTPYSALLLGQILRDVGLPDGAYNVVTGAGPVVGRALARHEGVAHVTFTGSVATGKSVMADAASHLASVTLELGGKSPLVVLDDADIDAAVAGAVAGIFTNAGQVCAAAARLIVLPGRAEEVVARVVARAMVLRLGAGLTDPDMGPVVSRVQLDRIARMVGTAMANGAQVLAGGKQAEVPGLQGGYFFQPTVLEPRDQTDEIVQEEVFGPVLVIQRAADLDQAIVLANGTRYGLVAGIYTRSTEDAVAFSRAVDCGQVYVNRYFGGGVETPVGGTRQSGFGREKGLRGIEAYLRAKCTTLYLGG